MRKLIQQRLKSEKGLTLVELLAVIVILGIIAAIATPAIGNIIENSKYNAVKSDAINVINAAQMYFAENPDKASVLVGDSSEDDSLIKEGFLDTPGKIPSEATISNSNPSTLDSKKEIDFSSGRKVTFTNATIKGISEDDIKGSDIEKDTPHSIVK